MIDQDGMLYTDVDQLSLFHLLGRRSVCFCKFQTSALWNNMGTGHVSVTASGRSCQSWCSQSPVPHAMTDMHGILHLSEKHRHVRMFGVN